MRAAVTVAMLVMAVGLVLGTMAMLGVGARTAGADGGPPGAPGPWVKVTVAGRDVWVPIDATGAPALPGPGSGPAGGDVPAGAGLALRLETWPAGAVLVIDGAELTLGRDGRGGLALALGPGRHTLEVRVPGASPLRLTLEPPPAEGGGYQVVPRP